MNNKINPTLQIELLTALAQNWPEDYRSGNEYDCLLNSARNVTEQIKDPYEKSIALGSLALLNPEFAKDALYIAKGLENKQRAEALVNIASHISQAIPAALTALDSIEDAVDGKVLWSNLAPHLSKEQLPEALRIARTIGQPYYKAQAFSALASQFASVRQEALETAQKLDKAADKAEILSLLAIEQQALPENVYASLADFVSDRLKEGSYEKFLGLMQQVQQDLEALTKKLLPPPG